MKKSLRMAAGMIAIAAAILLAGCRPQSRRSAPPATANNAGVVDLDAAVAKAVTTRRPVLVLIAGSGHSAVDDDARALLEDATVKEARARVTPVFLDLGISRNRATAARFHITDTDTPMLVFLSCSGVIVSRDEGPITKDLLVKRIDKVATWASDLDVQLALLEEAVAKNGSDPAARLNLADFLLGRQNAREAVAPLASVAHSEGIDPAVRVRAWVALARAHFWIGEPEKGRHEAKNLMATLGQQSPDAVSGGNLALGLQDATAKRFSVARREFEDAILAAPESTYAKQAADAISKLPTEGK